MDASSISGIASSATADRVSIAVARKAQDVVRDEGEAMVEMIRGASEVQRNIGGSGAVSGSGSLDTYA